MTALIVPNDHDPIARRNAYRELFRTSTSTSPALIETALTDESAFVRIEGLKQGNLTRQQYERAFNDTNEKVKAMAIGRFKLSHEQISVLLKDPRPEIKNTTVLVCDLTPEQLAHAFTDPTTRLSAIKTGKLTRSQIDAAMSDDSVQVREAAAAAGGKSSFQGTLKNVIYRVRCLF